MPEAKVGDVQVNEEADEVRGREEEGGILLHRLLLLVANEGGLANLRSLGPTGLGQKGGSHPLTRELGDRGVPQTLGTTQMHDRHAKLGKGVPRERHTKSCTREHGCVEWRGMRATGGGGVQDTHQHSIGTSVL